MYEDDIAREGEDEHYVVGTDDVDSIGGFEHQDSPMNSVDI